MDSIDWKLTAIGCGGAAIPDLLRIIQGRYSGALPNYLTSINFWLGFILLLFIGGLTAVIGGANGVKEALAFGYAAPEFVSRLLSSSAPPTRGRFSLSGIRHFWFY